MHAYQKPVELPNPVSRSTDPQRSCHFSAPGVKIVHHVVVHHTHRSLWRRPRDAAAAHLCPGLRPLAWHTAGPLAPHGGHYHMPGSEPGPANGHATERTALVTGSAREAYRLNDVEASRWVCMGPARVRIALLMIVCACSLAGSSTTRSSRARSTTRTTMRRASSSSP